jgi:hypothetical protein
LGYGQPAIFLDRLEAQGAVAAAARKHNADRTLSLIFGERLEKDVDGGSLVIGSPSAVQREPTLVDGQGRVRRQNMNLLWLNHLAVSGVEDRHRRGAAEYLGQHAFVAGGKVSHNDKGRAALGRHSLEELLQCLDAARRGADADNGQMGCHAFTVFLLFPLGILILALSPRERVFG